MPVLNSLKSGKRYLPHPFIFLKPGSMFSDFPNLHPLVVHFPAGRPKLGSTTY